MNYKQRAVLLILLVAALCGLAIWGVARWRYGGLVSRGQWLERLPAHDAVVFYIDLAALRRAGILQMLAGSPVAEEPEYKVFVMKTEFDYERDLDAVLAAFTPGGKYFVAQGRFNWQTLEAYVREQGGSCYNVLCRMSGSTPERKISFFPLRPRLMGLAVSPNESAALELQSARVAGHPIAIPDAPLWLSIPPARLKSPQDLPEAIRPFARSLENTQNIMLAMAPQGNRFEARLEVECRDERQAAELAVELAHGTALLGQMRGNQKQPANPRDLGSVLAAGSFRQAGARVFGMWPLERDFLEELLAAS